MRQVPFGVAVALHALVVGFFIACGKESTSPGESRGLSAKGNKIYLDGTPFVFGGVSQPSFEWSVGGENVGASSFKTIHEKWRANAVRLSLNQSFLLPGSRQYNQGYLGNIRNAVNQARNEGLQVILDLHWSDKGDLNGTGAQQCMADQNSLTFWEIVAREFRGNASVAFELYNEPHDITWDVWLSGGNACGFKVVGMQALYDAVRKTGARNLVLVGGLDYGYDLSGVPTHRVQGFNIAYATHPYLPRQDWERAFGNLSLTDPVIATEFGDFRPNCSPDYSQRLIEYARGKGVGWTAWAWYVPQGSDPNRFCTFPALINDWNGTATPQGKVVCQALGGNCDATK